MLPGFDLDVRKLRGLLVDGVNALQVGFMGGSSWVTVYSRAGGWSPLPKMVSSTSRAAARVISPSGTREVPCFVRGNLVRGKFVDPSDRKKPAFRAPITDFVGASMPAEDP